MCWGAGGHVQFNISILELVSAFTCVYSNHRVFSLIANEDTSIAIPVHTYHCTATASRSRITRYDITILALGHASIQPYVHIVPLLVIEGNEGFISPGEGNLIVAIVPPVVHAIITRDVPEFHLNLGKVKCHRHGMKKISLNTR